MPITGDPITIESSYPDMFLVFSKKHKSTKSGLREIFSSQKNVSPQNRDLENFLKKFIWKMGIIMPSQHYEISKKGEDNHLTTWSLRHYHMSRFNIKTFRENKTKTTSRVLSWLTGTRHSCHQNTLNFPTNRCEPSYKLLLPISEVSKSNISLQHQRLSHSFRFDSLK